ncbi:winged helix DNA-binding domain-containing protein [Actinoplanes sichuanensis]|uniref:Winged helix DNA-binding domain-containing protein n=1 Tax=Actinoplanes sichuanensis TaxID=512349 RepID=A0ABW4AJJ1_9ACTN|nr:winged helix DNA-binding domain-containing protein [Actinoplanes sichuanensis]BEL03867.1 winged helix DNA-binding domain-containing protein [Actinoplanes sichuanensis]
MEFSVEQVLAWRMRRQFLDRPDGVSAASIVSRLCGLQAQVASAAEKAIAARLPTPAFETAGEALQRRELIKVWAMRGTLHLLTAGAAASYLSLMAAARTWEKGSWQKTFATTAQLTAITDAAREILPGRVLTREQLTAEILKHTGDEPLAELLGSGWGTVLKPLAWQGYLCNGPNDGNRVTFTSPETWIDGWTGLPDPEVAAELVIPAYLGAFGPATMESFDQWLIRGASRKASLKSWFAGLTRSGVLTEVSVDGQMRYARTCDLDDIASAGPPLPVRLLPAFDQFLLGPGTRDPDVIAPQRRALISKAAGWIAPVVVAAGRVAGTWEPTDDGVAVTLFAEAGPVSSDELAAEALHLGHGDVLVTTA